MARAAPLSRFARRHLRLPRDVPGHRSRGLSLVELMISLVLGLVLVGGALSLYVTSRQSSRNQEGLARVQEGARFALDQMAREIRTAGVIPCGSSLTANVLVTKTASAPAAPWWADTHAGVLRGGENSDQGVLPTGTTVPRAAGTDSLVILRTSDDEGQYARVLVHDAAAFQFSVAASVPVSATAATPASAATVARIGEKDYALVCDSLSAALFQVDTVQVSAGLVNYGGNPSNCTTDLGSVNAACGSTSAKAFPRGALLVPWEPGFWYVGEPVAGRRALYRAAPDRTGTLQPVERVPAVENLQIEYLTRNNNSGGTLATAWVDASTLSGQWSNPALEVVALRLTLTLRHEAKAASAGASAPVERVFQSVVALRGKEP
ncbi:MAG: hypothetical protein RL513_795 [Pseudomonadota bacterium]